VSEELRNSPKSDAERDAHRATIERARERLGAIDGVLSVGFGQKHTAGSYRDVVAIAVFVSEKRPMESLTPDQRIPSEIDGIPTDVRVVQSGGRLVCNNSQVYNVIQGGIQIVPDIKGTGPAYDKGTLGCIVKRRGDTGRDNVYLLTCKHVLYSGGAKEDDYVHHPFAPPPHGQPAAGPSDVLGPIQKLAFERNVLWPLGPGTHALYHLDCATARINIDSKCWGSRCTKDKILFSPTIVDLDLGTDDPATPQHENQMISDVRNADNDSTIIGKTVYKVGRATGKTAGIVRAIASSVNVPRDPNDPNSPLVSAQRLIEIDFDVSSSPNGVNCINNERFAEGGDSGSVVVDADRKVIGLVAIGPTKASEQLPPPKKWAAWACHIVPVLDALGICIPTSGGTSHGSCSATDGSGLTAARPSVPVAGSPPGFDFSGAALSSSASTRDDDADTPLITDEQRSRMLLFRDALRESPRGRELHDSFVHVRRELGYLVRNSRPVKVVWHRNHGPAYFAHILNHLKGDVATVPHEIGGVTRVEFLTRMGKVLEAHGSNPVRAAIERYRRELLSTLSAANNIADCLRAIADLDRAVSSEEAQ
jgi:hypothetical protein